MTLREARVAFTFAQAALVMYARDIGIELAGNELKRDPRIAVLNAQSGSGIANSVHTLGLAIDFLAYRAGRYLTDSADYAQLGEHWKKLHPLARWGGDFKKQDGNHFSFEWEGVK